jgi:hypothetical protein
MSAYEGEHTIFGLLGQANLTQNDVLQFHPLFSNNYNCPYEVISKKPHPHPSTVKNM